MFVLKIAHLSGIQASDGSACSGCEFYVHAGPFVLDLKDTARAPAVCVNLEIRRCEQRQRDGGGGGGEELTLHRTMHAS